MPRRFVKRIIWTHTTGSTPDFWHKWWSDGDLRAKIKNIYSKPALEPYKKPLLRYLPKKGRILEAGCGYGRYVLALQIQGYSVEGIEYSKELVNSINCIVPDLPVHYGDATAIERPDGYYSAYISIGVMEHRIDGPCPFLRECSRVLAKDGIAFIAVPFYDLFWLLRSPWLPKGMPNSGQGEKFFQWHFTRSEFVPMIERAGLKVIDIGSVGVRKSAVQSIPIFQWLYQKRGGYRLWKLFSFIEGRCSCCGWMQWVVARKCT